LEIDHPLSNKELRVYLTKSCISLQCPGRPMDSLPFLLRVR